MSHPDLEAIAKAVADWVEPAPGIPAVYIFGSRVRGDYREDSDIDVRLYQDEWVADNETTDWWTEQNDRGFAELKAQLPGPLSIHCESEDAADPAIREGAKRPIYKDRKAVCVWTPPKPKS